MTADILVYLLFTLSGAAALVYQVVWQRVLMLVSGVGIYSVAMIVAAFLAGLGLGHHLGGLWSRRLPARRALLTFAWVEGGVALLAAGTCPFYEAYVLTPRPIEALWHTALRDFLLLLAPTTLMGMSLPLLVRAVAGSAERAPDRTTKLYAVNVAGAAFGALITPWVLIRYWGLSGAVGVAATMNATVALSALWLVRRLPADPSEDAPPPLATTTPAPSGHLEMWMALTALSGFCALALEVLWFRVVGVAVKSTAFTFGTVLCLYLSGIALGSGWAARRSRSFAHPLAVFLTCQCWAFVYCGLAMIVLTHVPVHTGLGHWYFDYWGNYDRLEPGLEWNWGKLLRLYLLFPIALFGPPTVLMGVAFRALQAAIHVDVQSSGERVGRIQAANIAGCVAGSLFVGLLAIQRVGTTGSLRVVLALGVAFALVGIVKGPRRAMFAALGTLCAGLVFAMPGQHQLWQRLHGSDGQALVDEDASGVAAVVPKGGGISYVFTNGFGESTFPYGGIHTVLGAAPVIVHQHPQRVLVVGLGSGDTAWAAGCRRETASIEVMELLAAQGRLLERVAAAGNPEVAQLIQDPRVHFFWTDGRQQLLRAETLYDVIEIDALLPTSAGSGNLNSVEFFTGASRKLAPKGLMCAWTPTSRCATAFRAAFPHVLHFTDEDNDFLIGSRDPLEAAPETWVERLHAERLVTYLGGPRAHEIARALRTGTVLDPLPVADRPPMDHDLFPADEFLSP